MGGCLTKDDVDNDDIVDDDNNNNNNNLNDDVNNNIDINCDWFKFPICCRYCSNHSEPLCEFQLVILGPGYTGKTTLRHHLVQRYGHAFCKADFLMYRDILQHNVLDLFRDLLQKPSLSFNQLKQFITYIQKKCGDEFELLSSFNYESELELNDLDENNLFDTDEFDLEYESTADGNKHNNNTHNINNTQLLKTEKMNFKAVNSNSSTHSFHDNDHNDDNKMEQEEDEQVKEECIIINNINNKNKINGLKVSIIDENNKDLQYDSDYGTIYNDKYCSINQCSPTTPNVENVNYEIFNVQTPKTSISSSSPSPNTLNPSSLFGKLDQFSHSETYQSTDSIHSINAINSVLSHSESTKSTDITTIESVKSDQQKKTNNNHNNDNNNKTNNHRWFNFLKNKSKNNENEKRKSIETLIQRRRSTLSALFNSFINHERVDKEGTDKPQIAETKEIEDDNNNDNDDDGLVITKKYSLECEDIDICETYGISSLSELLYRLNNEELKYGRDNGYYLILNGLRILDESFEPTFIDLLQCHVRSTGLMFENHVLCRSLPIDAYDKSLKYQRKQDIVFRVVDVGGHRNERKKWSYVLQQENDCIVFVVSAASFCQVLFEDFKKNAMRESISVWNDIISSSAEKNNKNNDTQFILVINKIDLFYQRCHLFQKYFPEYDGDINNKYDILNYIKSLYLDIAKKYNKNNVHCVCTKLTDSLEIATFDVEQIKDILMNYQIDTEYKENMHIHKDIVDTIIDYAIGDVFWSEKWLKPMWDKKMNKNNQQKNEKKQENKQQTQQQQQCDHINNPHNFHRNHNKRKTTKTRKIINQSITNRISAIFQSKQD